MGGGNADRLELLPSNEELCRGLDVCRGIDICRGIDACEDIDVAIEGGPSPSGDDEEN